MKNLVQIFKFVLLVISVNTVMIYENVINFNKKFMFGKVCGVIGLFVWDLYMVIYALKHKLNHAEIERDIFMKILYYICVVCFAINVFMWFIE